jgi:hypothetical protein
LSSRYYELVERILSVLKSEESVSGVLFVEEIPWLPFSFGDDAFKSLFVAAMCFLLIYVVCIPVVFAVVLHGADRSHERHHPALFLWENYQDKYFYFELVWLARRFLLALTVAVVPPESGFLSLVVVFVLCACAAFQIHMKPFALKAENSFDLLGIVVLLVSFSVNTWAQSLGAGLEQGESMQIVFYVVLGLNASYIVGLCLAASFPLWHVIFAKCRKKQMMEELQVGLDE